LSSLAQIQYPPATNQATACVRDTHPQNILHLQQTCCVKPATSQSIRGAYSLPAIGKVRSASDILTQTLVAEKTLHSILLRDRYLSLELFSKIKITDTYYNPYSTSPCVQREPWRQERASTKPKRHEGALASGECLHPALTSGGSLGVRRKPPPSPCIRREPWCQEGALVSGRSLGLESEPWHQESASTKPLRQEGALASRETLPSPCVRIEPPRSPCIRRKP
jgi:hypothetical protein